MGNRPQPSTPNKAVSDEDKALPARVLRFSCLKCCSATSPLSLWASCWFN